MDFHIAQTEALVPNHSYGLNPMLLLVSIVQILDPLTLRAAKSGLTILKYFSNKNMFGESKNNLPSKFGELSLYSQVISKNMKVADDTFQRNSDCEWVNEISVLYECSEKAKFILQINGKTTWSTNVDTSLRSLIINLMTFLKTHLVSILLDLPLSSD